MGANTLLPASASLHTLHPTSGAVWHTADQTNIAAGNAANGVVQMQCAASTPSVPTQISPPVTSSGALQAFADRARSQSPVQRRGWLDTQSPLPHGRAPSPTFSSASCCGAARAQPRHATTSQAVPLTTVVHGSGAIPAVQLSGSTTATALPSTQPYTAPAQLRRPPCACPVVAQMDPRVQHGNNVIQMSGVAKDDVHARPLKMVENVVERNGCGPPLPPPPPPPVVPSSSVPQEPRIGAYYPDADTFTI